MPKYRIVEIKDNDNKYYTIEKKYFFMWLPFYFSSVLNNMREDLVDSTIKYKAKFKTLFLTEYIVKNYKKEKYKGVTIYPCLNTDETEVLFYAKFKNKHRKRLIRCGSIEYIKGLIDNDIKNKSGKRVVKLINI